MAKENNRLNSILSLPVFIFLFFTLVETIEKWFFMYSLGIIEVLNSSLTGLINITINIFYIIHKCNDIECSFKRIVLLCAQTKQQTTSQFFIQTCVRKPSRSDVIKLQHLEIYRYYFGMRLFSVCQLDFSKMIALELMIVNLSVLFSQTQNK